MVDLTHKTIEHITFNLTKAYGLRIHPSAIDKYITTKKLCEDNNITYVGA